VSCGDSCSGSKEVLKGEWDCSSDTGFDIAEEREWINRRKNEAAAAILSLETRASTPYELLVNNSLFFSKHRLLAARRHSMPDEFAARVRSLCRTISGTQVVYRIIVSLAILFLSPVAFEYLVRAIPQAWLQAAGMRGAYSWLGLVLFLGIIPAVVAGVGYSAAQSERANRLTPELIAITRSRCDDLTETELRSAAGTLRAASSSRWCDRDIRRDAADEAERLEGLLEERCAYPIPAATAEAPVDQLPLVS
jgi:hypothetical protein